MIIKLEESARLIAMTERDMAWREMAKQVAHEIKNPLTPMKLSIQYLQNTLASDPERAQNIAQNISNTIIEQIDNLSHIATEFSNFAKMPKATNEKIILNEVLTSTHDLFRERDDMDISLYVPIDEIYVFADRHQLLRLFNNLIKNAIQSIPKSRRGAIDIRLYRKSDIAIVSISDNGSGIEKEMQNRVFYPNFTTKSSGTGLGLAISSNIIETLNGRIYFETREGDGTTFYVEIPFMHLKDNYNTQERVVL